MAKKKTNLGPTYGKITFAVGYNKSFAEFKKEFQDTEDFRTMPEHLREDALKEAYNIATNKNGDTSTTAKQGENAKS